MGDWGSKHQNRILHCSQTVRVRRNRQRFRYASKTGKATLPRARRPTRTRIETIFTFLSSSSLVESDVGVLSNCPKCPSAIPAAQTRQPPTPRFANLASVFGNTQMQRFISCLILTQNEKKSRTPSKHDSCRSRLQHRALGAPRHSPSLCHFRISSALCLVAASGQISRRVLKTRSSSYTAPPLSCYMER